MKLPRHPTQPLVHQGMLRFRGNKIVQYMLECTRAGRRADLNDLADLPFSVGDREQLMQLLGYSAGCFMELDFVRPETLRRVEAAMDRHARRRAAWKAATHG